MAILRGNIDFTGSLGGLSAYKRKDMDETIVRSKGGASKTKIKNSPAFVRTRENNREFMGCGRAASIIRWALKDVKHLADYNFTPELTKLAKLMQTQDTANVRGERSVLISEYRYMLEGFNLNRRHTFDSVLRYPLKGSINRSKGTAELILPNMRPEVNLFLPWKYPMYRFVISLQAITDVVYNYPRMRFEQQQGGTAPVYTEWLTAGQPYGGETVLLAIEKWKEDKTLILSVGIEIGMPGKYLGCAKILAVG
jgi:hypothetical protein